MRERKKGLGYMREREREIGYIDVFKDVKWIRRYYFIF